LGGFVLEGGEGELKSSVCNDPREGLRVFDTFFPGDRWRSWETCYGFFRGVKPSGITAHQDHAVLQLGFYLASWGMYRGSTFLLKHSSAVHWKVVDCVASPRFAPLWEREFGSEADDVELVPVILEARDAVIEAYKEFGQPTETLVTKVLLGTFGCLPACDQYFIAGFRNAGLGYSNLNAKVVKKLLNFSREHLTELRSEQVTIRDQRGAHYPLMKLVDMYFWQLGYEAGAQSED
jgi:hypothetical protein